MAIKEQEAWVLSWGLWLKRDQATLNGNRHKKHKGSSDL